MGEKETTQKPKEPTPEELEKMLSKDEAEMQEFFKTTEDPKMKRIGATDELRVREPEEAMPGGKSGEDIEMFLADYIKKWASHADYQPRNFEENAVEIVNNSDVDVTPEFIDDLLNAAKKFLHSKNQDLSGINSINFRIDHEANTLNLMVKNVIKFGEVASSLFYFEITPPFTLKKINSAIFGIYILN